jgi:hypothetical protein
MATGSGKRCTWVELGIMIKWSSEGGMGVAKDVATLSAVMATSEVAESTLASRVVADSGFGIRLPVLARGLRLDLGKHLGIEVAINAALRAIASGNTRQFVAKDRHARDVHETAVGTSQGVLRLCAGGGCTIINRHLAGL